MGSNEFIASILGLSLDDIDRIVSILQGCVIGPGFTPLTEEQFSDLELQQLLAPLGPDNGIRLVKYFPDTVDAGTGLNYSRMALERGSVHVSKPQLFNDPFDCLPGVNRVQAEVGLLCSIARYLDISLQGDGSLDACADELAYALNRLPEEGLPVLASRTNSGGILMQLNYLDMLTMALSDGAFTRQGLMGFARHKVSGFCNVVRNCRISCFSTNPLNLHMWSHYANEHRGFCIEYETDRIAIAESGVPLAYYETLYGCIYGVYYHQRRPVLASEIFSHC